MVESHVLVPSKLFVGQFDTLNGRTVQIDGNKISTRQGWDHEPVTYHILFEELFYNSDWKKFRVVCLDGALVGGLPPGENNMPKIPRLAHRTLVNCRDYLEAFPENELVLRKIRQYVDTFVSSYYIVKGFEHHAHDKVQQLLNKSIDDLLCTNKVFRQFHYEDRHMESLSMVVESFLFEGLHDKLFASMCETHREQDENLHELAAASRATLTLSQMGSGEAFAADDLPLAVATMREMESRRTPLEKLLCLKECIDGINNDLIAFRERQSAEERVRGLQVSQESLVTTDELLPLLVFVIVRSDLKHAASTVAYAEYFTFFNVQTSELGFILSTFKAALALMAESRLLRRNRREKWPDSRHNEKRGRKSLSARRTNELPHDAMKRTISVPAGMTEVLNEEDAARKILDSKYLGFATGGKDDFSLS